MAAPTDEEMEREYLAALRPDTRQMVEEAKFLVKTQLPHNERIYRGAIQLLSNWQAVGDQSIKDAVEVARKVWKEANAGG